LNNKKYFNSSNKVFSWLDKYINLERGQKPKSFLLERMEVLTELANHPERCAPSIHIAGSKGKGSVTGMLSAMLTAAGFRAARYMSPHVVDIRERICLGDSYFDEEIYVSAGDELRHITEDLLPAKNNTLFDINEPNGSEPTFWELLTLLFFLCARQAKCDAMVVETGMGGRLDSTNVLDPLVTVITLIELEHTSILGGTIAEIAGEKAGIIKSGKPLILAKQNNEALKVFVEKAKEKNSPIYYYPEIAELSKLNITKQGTEFDLSFNVNNISNNSSTPHSAHYTLKIPLPGKVQAENASLAVAALNVFFNEISHTKTQISGELNRKLTAQGVVLDKAIRDGLANFRIPGRFENITSKYTRGDIPFIIDGAHTAESFSLCVDTFCSLYGEGGVLIFGCAADKDAAAMAKPACGKFSKIIITTPGTFKISDPAKVYETFAKEAGQEKTELVKDTNEAVRQTQCYAKENNLPILGAGSFYLVSEIRKIVLNQPYSEPAR